LKWIDSGVYFEMKDKPEPFFDKQILHSDKALNYWNEKLRPHYIASGAIE
jgi:hypothetical protein